MSIAIIAHVRDFSKSRGDAKFLLLTIASHINPQLGWAWPSLDTLAHEITKGKPYTLKLIDALEDLGELEVRRGRGRGHPNHYRITISHEPPPERPRKGHPGDEPVPEEKVIDAPEKGHPRDNHFLGEKVIGGMEKVILAPGKGNPSDDSKEILERKEKKNVNVDVDCSRGETTDQPPDPEPLDPYAADVVEQCIEWFNDAHSRGWYHQAIRSVGAQVFYALMLSTWEQRARIHCLGAYLTVLLKGAMTQQGRTLGGAMVTPSPDTQPPAIALQTAKTEAINPLWCAACEIITQTCSHRTCYRDDGVWMVETHEGP